jgi:hypothetical protein
MHTTWCMHVLGAQAYQYTSVTSVALLDCFTIPAAIMLSWIALR